MSAVLAPRRLPGLRVERAPQPAPETLPRMDIAVFAGFAATGPLHLPVVVETVAQYADVFGPDAPLAWDAERGERVYAHLGPAVRAFFSNGGRRCWVIRVARPTQATANRFAIPGVLQVGAADGVAAAIAAARCEGSWSDGLRVSCALARRSAGVNGLEPIASPAAERYRFSTPTRVRTGDLLELGNRDTVSAYAVVDAVSTARSEAEGPYIVDITVRAAFERLAAGSPPLPAESPAPGAWARWTDGSEVVWQRADSVAQDSSIEGPAWRELPPALPLPIGAIAEAGVLALEMRVRDPAGRAFRLSDVGLTPQHAAAWWNQATDAEHYKPREEAATVATSEGARFPLAAEGGSAALAWIPLGVEPLFGPECLPLPQQASALERDGLAQFDESLFLDPELASAGVGTLVERADNIRFLRASPRRLLGIHGALSVGRGGLFNEASLLVIPDAVHTGWVKRGPAEVDPPEPGATSYPPHWTRHRGPCVQPLTPAPRAKTEDCASDWEQLCFPGTPGAEARPPIAVEPDFGVFLDCATRRLEAPELSGPAEPATAAGYRLTWSDAEPGATYVLREAQRPDFKDAREVYRGAGLEYAVAAPREGVYYYQVVAELGDERSEGSNAVFVVVREDQWVVRPAAEFGAAEEAGLFALHRAALRLAAASGELFAVLALPRHYRAPAAARYADRLRVVGHAERRMLSYGALYHPWVASGVRGGALRIVPPDGFAAGVLAARASARGAWIAPANEPFRDAVALTPPIDPADWQALQDAQINVVRLEPRGFLALSADTLAHADDVDLRPINVRRLLILLRRLALRRGTSYVFEPNGPLLRRAVQRGFDRLLDDLFRRGAFAGETAGQSFRVVTDDTINTPRDADAGRFIVELRVAPSVPMRFLSILLAQTGERLTVAEEL